MMKVSIGYLSRLCRHWGGSLELVSGRDFIEQVSAPCFSLHPNGSHAIDLVGRRILVERAHVNPGTLIHEMGHLFLEEGDPATTYEPNWLGWEIVLARRARCYRTWSAQNADYRLPGESLSGESLWWKDLPFSLRRRLIDESITDAKDLGIVSPRGVPLCTRSVR
jgi:hypothetical protein